MLQGLARLYFGSRQRQPQSLLRDIIRFHQNVSLNLKHVETVISRNIALGHDLDTSENNRRKIIIKTIDTNTEPRYFNLNFGICYTELLVPFTLSIDSDNVEMMNERINVWFKKQSIKYLEFKKKYPDLKFDWKIPKIYPKVIKVLESEEKNDCVIIEKPKRIFNKSKYIKPCLI